MTENLADLEAKLIELKRQQAIELARSHFANFVQYVKPDYRMQWYHRQIADVCDRVAHGRNMRVILNLPPRAGKRCADSTPVLTIDGWKTHGELQPGDFVFHPSGAPAKVLACGSEGVTDRLVTFTDGSSVKVHGAHEWRVKDRRAGIWKTVETDEIAKQVWLVPQGKRGSRARYQIPLAAPVDFPEIPLVMEPYVLGAWLGDGTSSKPWITHPECDSIIAEQVDLFGYKRTKVYKHRTTGVLSSVFAGTVPGGNGSRLWREIKELGLVNNKHIPSIYQRASVAQRCELLAGLVDTDGSTDRNGRIHFSNTNKRLIDDVVELVRGLGCRTTLTVDEPKLSSSGIQGRKRVYQVAFNPVVLIPCRVPRKQPKRYARPRQLAIAAVEPVQSEPGKCIQVDSPDGLYLVGRNLTPTHNSELVSRCFPAYLLGINPDMSIIATSYNAELASMMNRDVQRVIDSDPYRELFPDTRLAAMNSRAVAGRALRNSDVFEVVDRKGIYRSAGVGGSVTGLGGNCFVGGTMVETEQGRSSIKRLCLMDPEDRPRVLAFNHEKERVEPAAILGVRQVMATDLVAVVVEGGREVWCTPEHRFYSTPRGAADYAYRESVGLVDHEVWMAQGWARVIAVCPMVSTPTPVYDIEVERHHNFFANGMLAHNCLIVDDPIKNEEEARSPTYREKVWQWYTNTLLTRQQSGASVLICMTRWSADDLVGRLEQRAQEDPKSDQWEVIRFRAIREEEEHTSDPRQVGEALWPEDYPIEYLEKMRASMGEAAFAGLYQQRPNLQGRAALPEHRWCFWYEGPEPPSVIARNEDGDLTECRQERLPQSFDFQYQSWDMSFKDLAQSDWVVGQVHAAKGARDYLLDQVRGRWDFARTQQELKLFTEKHPRCKQILIEDKANGPAVMSAAKLTIPGLIPVTPEGGKEARVNAITYLHEAGNLFIPHPSMAPWVRGFIQECAQFPRGRFDDQIDSFSQAINWKYHGKRKKKWGKVRVAYG